MATRAYAVLTDSNPAELLAELTSQELAFVEATELAKTKPVFVQQYINGRMASSWTVAQLGAKLSK